MKNFNILKNLEKNFFILISLYFALLIKDQLAAENSIFSVLVLYTFIFIIFLFEFIFLYFSQKLFNRFFFKVTLILFIFFNFYTLSLSISTEFTSLERLDKLFKIFLYLFITSVLVYFFLKNKNVLKTLCFFYLILNVVLILNLNKIFLNYFDNNNQTTFKFTDKKFKKTPNIYIFSVESLIPKTIISNHLKINDFSYIKTLEENGYKVFDNNFSDDYATRESLNAVLNIDQIGWKKIRKTNYFSGKANSPLFDLLRFNNYKIITGYHDSHFGPPGKYVDNYLTFRSLKSKNPMFDKLYTNFCQFKMPWYHFQVFGYCDIIKLSFRINKDDLLLSKNNFEENLFNVINSKEKKFAIFHVITHSHPNLDTKDFTKQFIENINTNSILFERLVNTIKKNDPNSLLIVFGDHGPALMKFSKEKKFKNFIMSSYNNDPVKAELMDKYATLGSIYDNLNLCNSWISDLNNKPYTTNSMILNTVLKCLIEKENFTDIKLTYSLGKKLDYNDLIYNFDLD